MGDFKYESRQRQNTSNNEFENQNRIDSPIPSHLTGKLKLGKSGFSGSRSWQLGIVPGLCICNQGYLASDLGYWSLEDGNIGGDGDRLRDLECRLATSLSKELLSALDAPNRRPLPDFERNKVACLKNAILELQRENDALSWELWRSKRAQNQDERRDESSDIVRPESPEKPARGCEKDAACQTSQSVRATNRSTRSHTSIAGSTIGEAKSNHPQVSSHSKCVDWLNRRKSVRESRDNLQLVRLVLWQLWELADHALTQSEPSIEKNRLLCSDNATEDERNNDDKESGRTIHQIEQLRLQLENLVQSKERLKRRSEEQALLLRQKEIQVLRLQRSRTQLTRTFKKQLALLRQQQDFEIKALQLQMQNDRASSLVDQSAKDEELQGAVDRLEERYRGLLRDAYKDKNKGSLCNPQSGSPTGRNARAQSGS